MSRIKKAFETDQIHLIPYLMTGDPNLKITLDLIRMLAEEGVTAIELGVPFSDPTADGPVIQAAGERALKNEVSLFDVLTIGETVRKEGIQVPLILFTYYNPILQYGLERLVEKASQAGFDGVIVADLPYEESHPFSKLAQEKGLSLIPLVTPTSRQRIQKLVAEADGFVYCVSSLGTTGMRSDFADDIETFLTTVRELSPVPTAVGFGISHREHVLRFSTLADGVIVGSALVKKIEEESQALQKPELYEEALGRIRLFVRELKTD